MVNPEETKRQKARNLRYRKAIVKDINLDTIKENLWEIYEACSDVQYFYDDEETLMNALDGDEDEAQEFKMMFSDLCCECEQMREDLSNEYVPDCFDNFFTAISKGESLMGWDSYEQDYMGLSFSYEEEEAREEAKKRLSRLTKEQIMDAAQICFRIFRNYISLQHRYDCLKSAMDILRDKNTKYLQEVNKINEIYEKANADGIFMCRELDRLIANMPSDVWLH